MPQPPAASHEGRLQARSGPASFLRKGPEKKITSFPTEVRTQSTHSSGLWFDNACSRPSSVAKFCSGFRHCYALPAPLAVFCCVHHMGMLHRHSNGANVEIRRRLGRESHRHQWTFCAGRFHSCRARPPLSPPRHISSPTHFPELGSRVSAGFFASTAGVVGQRAQVALWSMGVHLPLGAHGAFAAVLGMAAGSAVRVRASRSRVLLVCLCASLVPHCG